jgi:hypothetical protein
MSPPIRGREGGRYKEAEIRNRCTSLAQQKLQFFGECLYSMMLLLPCDGTNVNHGSIQSTIDSTGRLSTKPSARDRSGQGSAGGLRRRRRAPISAEIAGGAGEIGVQ